MGVAATRSSEKVARELGKSAQLFARWSVKWNWVDRVSEWGDEQDRQNRIAQTIPVAPPIHTTVGCTHRQQKRTP